MFASGNGGAVDDQCNFDGYTNSLMSITVGAIDRKGLHPFYSEACAANMVVTYSSGSGDNIVSSICSQSSDIRLTRDELPCSTRPMSARTSVQIDMEGRLLQLRSLLVSLPSFSRLGEENLPSFLIAPRARTDDIPWGHS